LDWDINTGYHSNYTHRPVGLGHQHGRALHTNDGRKDKSKTASPPTNHTHASNEPWSEAHRQRKKLRGRHHRITEGPPPCGVQRCRSAAPTLTARQREEHRVRRNTCVRGDHQPATQHASLSCAGTFQPAARHHTSESSCFTI
jgi:hypothetical protein